MNWAAVKQGGRWDYRATDDLLHSIARAKSQRDLEDLSIEVLDYFRFDHLCIARKPRVDKRFSDGLLFFGRNTVRVEDLDSARLNTVLARAFRHASKDVGCLHLLLDRSVKTEGGNGDHLPDFGLGSANAFFFPADSPKGGRGVIGFFGARKWTDATELAELNYIAMILFDRICRRTHSPHRASKLTKREYECLYWTAAGKTSAEIGTILSLSEHTINNYLVSVCHKLDSVNRAHAVAKAIRQGIIS